MKVPTCIVQSSSFLDVMCANDLGFGKEARTSYNHYVEKFAQTIPNSKGNFQAVTITNSSHMDQCDFVLYRPWEN